MLALIIDFIYVISSTVSTMSIGFITTVIIMLILGQYS